MINFFQLSSNYVSNIIDYNKSDVDLYQFYCSFPIRLSLKVLILYAITLDIVFSRYERRRTSGNAFEGKQSDQGISFCRGEVAWHEICLIFNRG